MTNIGLLHEISATFINICINLMQIYQKHAQTLCKIDLPFLRMVDTFGVVKLRLFTHSLDRFTSDGPFP